MNSPLHVTVLHLFEVPQQRRAVAELIHDEFWTQVPGASVETMAARLLQAARADCLPLCLVALQAGEVVGVVNLVDNDDEQHTEWSPWLAGLVVRADWRGRGVGSALVPALLGHAWRLGFERVYFGTDGPAFYARLGAVVHEQPRADFWFMRFDRGSAWPATGVGSSAMPARSDRDARAERGRNRRNCRRPHRGPVFEGWVGGPVGQQL